MDLPRRCKVSCSTRVWLNVPLALEERRRISNPLRNHNTRDDCRRLKMFFLKWSCHSLIQLYCHTTHQMSLAGAHTFSPSAVPLQSETLWSVAFSPLFPAESNIDSWAFASPRSSEKSLCNEKQSSSTTFTAGTIHYLLLNGLIGSDVDGRRRKNKRLERLFVILVRWRKMFPQREYLSGFEQLRSSSECLQGHSPNQRVSFHAPLRLTLFYWDWHHLPNILTLPGTIRQYERYISRFSGSYSSGESINECGLEKQIHLLCRWK